MPSFKYNPTNTEGAFPESIDFLDTEIKKGDKIVATDLVDLYDTDIVDPVDGDALYYDAPTEMWRNGDGAGGGGCDNFTGYTEDIYTNSVHIDADSLNTENGMLNSPFISLKNCFDFLNECKNISEDITIVLHSDIEITEEVSLNHPQGHRITIDGNNNSIINDKEISITYSLVANYHKAIHVGAGTGHNLIIKPDGTLWGSGDNTYGQMGFGDDGLTSYVRHTKVGSDNDWYKVFCGNNTSYALKNDGTLWSCGLNDNGQLGLGDLVNRNEFTIITTDIGTDTWVDISIGEEHTFAMTSSGDLYATGSSEYGQLGFVDELDRSSFSFVSDSYVSFSCGAFHTMCVKSDGTMWGTGRNNNYQLGLSTITSRLEFEQIGTDTDWDMVSCGYYHTMAIKTTGTLWGTGNNLVGQLGVGNTNNQQSFTQAGTDTNWRDVACSASMSGAIKTTGTLWFSGAYVNNTTFQQEGTSTWDSITGGYSHMMIINTSYNLYGIGSNASYQIGYLYSLSTQVEPVTYSYLNITNTTGNDSHIVLYNNHNIKEIRDVDIKSDITMKINNITISEVIPTYDITKTTTYYLDFSPIEISNNSSISLNNVTSSLTTKRYVTNTYTTYVIEVFVSECPVLCSNHSVTNLGSTTLDGMKVDSASIIADNVTSAVDWVAVNNSTVIINDTPTVEPTMDISNSVYIINGVQQ